MKILNLYSGIGGNRALWGNSHNITAIEIDKDRGAKYEANFPKDKVIITDAHEYLLNHFKEFDFIWSSPPCQSHSRTNYFLKGRNIYRYPDLKLYEEIIFLNNFFKGKYCVENVISYYTPLIKPIKIGRHYLWSNFHVSNIDQPKDDIGKMCGKNQKANKKHIDIRNSVNSDLGLHILKSAEGIVKANNIDQIGLFE